MGTETRFEKKAKGNSEMDYSTCRHRDIVSVVCSVVLSKGMEPFM